MRARESVEATCTFTVFPIDNAPRFHRSHIEQNIASSATKWKKKQKTEKKPKKKQSIRVRCCFVFPCVKIQTFKNQKREKKRGKKHHKPNKTIWFLLLILVSCPPCIRYLLKEQAVLERSRERATQKRSTSCLQIQNVCIQILKVSSHFTRHKCGSRTACIYRLGPAIE